MNVLNGNINLAPNARHEERLGGVHYALNFSSKPTVKILPLL